MTGDTVIVTGGTFGIGRDITLHLAGAGWRVVAFGLEAPSRRASRPARSRGSGRRSTPGAST